MERLHFDVRGGLGWEHVGSYLYRKAMFIHILSDRIDLPVNPPLLAPLVKVDRCALPTVVLGKCVTVLRLVFVAFSH